MRTSAAELAPPALLDVVAIACLVTAGASATTIKRHTKSITTRLTTIIPLPPQALTRADNEAKLPSGNSYHSQHLLRKHPMHRIQYRAEKIELVRSSQASRP